MEVRPPFVLRGVTEISRAVGINNKRFRHYIDNMGLPAFQIEPGGLWLALPEDLERWIREQRDARLKK